MCTTLESTVRVHKAEPRDCSEQSLSSANSHDSTPPVPGIFEPGVSMSGDLSTVASAHGDLCRFLSACYCEPTSDFVEEHLFDSILAAATAIHPALVEPARRLREAFFEQDMQSLLIDHTALFIGPSQPKAMPYASFWLTDDQSMRHEATMAVVDFYEQGGFDVSEDIHELPDHIAVELEFLYALIFAQNQARIEGNIGELSAAEALHQRFLGEHLRNWIDPFAEAVKAGAGTVFYRELAAITQQFVRIEVGYSPTSFQ